MAGFTHIAIGATVAFALATATAAAGPVSHLDLSGLPLSSPAGTVVPLTVTAVDSFGNVDTTYAGTIHFTSSDFLAILPSDYTFSPFDNGIHAFSVEFQTPGSQTITVTDTVVGSITGRATTTVGVASVPEPASLTVLAMGLTGLGMVLRTRRA